MKLEQKLSRVLLIDDSSDDNFFHRIVLEEMDIAEQIDEVRDGEQALDYITGPVSDGSTDECPCPELIFLDINMPRMDGWEFLEKYSELSEQEKGGPVIVMLSTTANPEEHLRAEQFPDVRKFTNKPLDARAVEEILHEFFSSRLATND